MCECLHRLEEALLKSGAQETARGPVWSRDCREWVYFDCVLDLVKLRAAFALPAHVIDHEHRGTQDGNEKGFYCQNHKDGVMGLHPDVATQPPASVFSGPDNAGSPADRPTDRKRSS